MIEIPKPPWSHSAKELESSVRKAVYDFELFPPDVKKVAVALSGGKDSMALLFLLNALRGRGFPNFDLIAIHVDGEFSCGAGVNGEYLQSICSRMNVPFIVRQSTQTREGLECYRCSRERRRLIFEAAKEHGASLIAFGHHRDDSAQTLLLNLLHKAEFAANLPKVPMIQYGVTIIRPMIYISEDDIRSFAKQTGFARITCQCPVGQHSKRKVVADLIQQLQRDFPNAAGNLAKAGLLYGSDKALTP